MHSRASIALIAAALVVGTAAATDDGSPPAVEWRVADGGNGHWYRIILIPTGTSWSESKLWSERLGGHLATITSASENLLLSGMVGTSGPWFSRYGSDPRFDGPWIGGFRESVGAPWQWVTGELWSFTAWCSNQPSDVYCPSGEIRLSLKRDAYCGPTQNWGDVNDSGDCLPFITTMGAMLVEWETDCNGDGIVDYGQIQSGQLQDDNQNNVPDVCEYTVTGVIPVSGAASGGTSVIINGTNFPQNPAVLIGGSAATDVVRVSANRITAVTPVGLPGMTSVAVGNWVQPNAFYYRPECGSDLDQDGEVTASDIAIVLLDFGPCYATANSTQQEDSRPFMLREQSAPVAPRSN